MTQTADIINFERPVVKADKDDGFAPIAIRLAQAFASNKLSPNQNRVIWAIVTKTYGWQKSFDWICNEQISDITATDGEENRLPKNKVSEAKNQLIKRNILIQSGREIGINPVVSEWLEKPINPEIGTGEKSRNQDSIIPKSGQNNPEIRTKQSRNQEPQKKETITKERTKKINKKSLLETLDFSTWPALPNQQIFDDWVAMRKAKKASISQTVINNFGKQFQIAFQNGLSVDECLSECITRNWQGFKYSWIANANQSQYSGMAQRQSNNVGDQLAYLQDSLAHIPTPHDDEVL